MTIRPPLLQIDDLHVSFPSPGGRKTAVNGVSLRAERGQITGLAGESGSGKSTIAFAILRYLGRGSIDRGTILVDGNDITKIKRDAFNTMRASHMALVPQDPLASLNPSMRIAAQLLEISRQRELGTGSTNRRVEQMLEQVRLPSPQRILQSYPHQLSGGQQQRVLIAMALLSDARLLLLDEPTTGLDASVQADIVELVSTLVRERDLACLFISHDLDLLARCCPTLAIMQNGQIVEAGPSHTILSSPQQSYTQKLLAARPSNMPPRAPRDPKPVLTPLLQAYALNKTYKTAGSWFSQSAQKRSILAAQNVSFTLASGETLAVIGESGSGKSTLAKLLLGLERPDSGTIELAGANIADQSLSQRQPDILHAIQMVFQNPASTLNPSHTIAFQLARALACASEAKAGTAEFSTIEALLQAVHLPPETAEKNPAQLSGGQKQRVAIARALAARPQILVADEPVSALDVSVQASIIALLLDLQRQLGLALVFISHDLPLVRAVAHRVVVLHRGAIVETGDVTEVFTAPQHPYTRALLAAAMPEDAAA